MDEISIIIILGAIFLWLFILPIVLLVKTSRLKADAQALKKELTVLTVRTMRLEKALQKSPDALNMASAAAAADETRDTPRVSPAQTAQPATPRHETPAQPARIVGEKSLAIDISIPPASETSAEPPSVAPNPPRSEPKPEPAPTPEPVSPAAEQTSRPSQPSRPSRPSQPSQPSRPQPPRPSQPRTHRPPPPPPQPVWLEQAKAWLLGGNTVLRVGVTLLFIGLAFLLRYASEQFVVPVEVRYIGVALTALVLLVLGWRLRRKKPAYGLILQGTGIAVLYLTTFAALRLHPLLSSSEAFTILVSVTLCSVILAVAQNALGLALVSVLGGFAAPILTSTGSGNHVALFSYFALLNAGIVLIAWFKAWRILNLAGFIGTFGIGFAWGTRSYTPQFFDSTEAFLILFFLMYVSISLLFTRRRLLEAENAPENASGNEASGREQWLRWSTRKTDYLDGSMIFGPPILGFGLQCALIQHIEFGMAFSALLLGLFYLILAFLLRQTKVILLTEICLALCVIFGSLAVPLALDAQWTSAAWAVEGAGLYWLGLRRSRPLTRAFALLLMLASSLTYLSQMERGDDTLLSGSVLGAFLLGAALLFAWRSLRRTPQAWRSDSEAAQCQPILAVSGLCFLYLIAPLSFDAYLTAASWALAGLLTLFIGLRLGARAFLSCALWVQLLGGLVFLQDISFGSGGNVFHSGWYGLLCASFLGLTLVASALLAQRNLWVQGQPELSKGFGLALLAGLVFLNLAALFVLDWTRAGAAWAISGLVIFSLGYALRLRPAFYFGLCLEAAGGMAFLLDRHRYFAFAPETTPFLHTDFWVPATLSLAALVCAWRLHRAARQGGSIED
ncbi:MAG: DUF2339 domain-containing protein [Zoogloeaceae bacterium]|jgi:uncharacterized membrane protein|nr:DUF2339 domain-containing protein [Zoogloeaceae bacterium]